MAGPAQAEGMWNFADASFLETELYGGGGVNFMHS